MPKTGFNNQWIQISREGIFKDSKGVERDLNGNFLKQVVANFQENNAPAVIGHPKDNTPAFGWVSALRLNNGVLEAQFSETDDDFEQMVAEGKFKKRSASFYVEGKPRLKHVGFLGAMPPAIKGLRDIQFNDGESVTVEISFNEELRMSNENANTQEDKKTFKEWWKELFGGATPSASTANFSEVDKSQIDAAVATAVKTATDALVVNFNEELGKRDKQIETLMTSANSQTASGRRALIDAYIETIPVEKGRHYLKRVGIAEFMESLAEADAAEVDGEVAISFSEGEGENKVEHKATRVEWFKNYIDAQQNFIEFGEKFGTLVATSEVSEVIDPSRAATINSALGLKGGDE